nr:hypothetical protein [Micromonospora sp. DSM 115978]
MVWLGPLLPIDSDGRALYVRPELTDDDVTWLNAEIELAGNPTVRYSREYPAALRGYARQTPGRPLTVTVATFGSGTVLASGGRGSNGQ